MFSKKHFLAGMMIGVVLLFAAILSIPDGKLHIVFCNVGQGDAAYIRTPSNQDMLIDGGPDDKVLSCLGRHMPFYDRTIDVVLLSHPQKDWPFQTLNILATKRSRLLFPRFVNIKNCLRIKDEIKLIIIEVINRYTGYNEKSYQHHGL